MERECYEGEVQPYRKMDYKPMMMCSGSSRVYLAFWDGVFVCVKNDVCADGVGSVHI